MSNKYYFSNVNLLRGIAALMVCFFHFTNYSDFRGNLFYENSIILNIGKYGKFGVYIFFVITGFVIPLSLFKNNFNIKKTHKFLIKRLIRLEIPYLFSILLTLFVAYIFSVKNQTQFHFEPYRFLHHVFYTSEFFNVNWYNPIYWTLAIEIQFYILIALIFPLLNIENKSINIIVPIILGGTTLFVESTIIIFHYGAIFAIGICLFLLLFKKINIYLGLLNFLFLIIVIFVSNGLDVAIFSLITLIFIAFIKIDKKIFNFLGKISYSLYLTHGIFGLNLIYILNFYTFDVFYKIGLIILALISSIFFAYYFWKYIEYPSKLLSQKYLYTE